MVTVTLAGSFEFNQQWPCHVRTLQPSRDKLAHKTKPESEGEICFTRVINLENP